MNGMANEELIARLDEFFARKGFDPDKDGDAGRWVGQQENDMIVLLRDCRSALSAVGEPQAWYHSTACSEHVSFHKQPPDNGTDWRTVPLYAHPEGDRDTGERRIPTCMDEMCACMCCPRRLRAERPMHC